MWVRAVWIENDKEEEGVIPEVWIQGQNVRWPTGLNVLKAFSEKREPLEKWHKFPLLKIKFTSVDRREDYEFTTWEETSDEENNNPKQKSQGKENNNPLDFPSPPSQFIARHGQEPFHSTPRQSRPRSTNSPKTNQSDPRSSCLNSAPRLPKNKSSQSNSLTKNVRRSRSRSLRRSQPRCSTLSRSRSPSCSRTQHQREKEREERRTSDNGRQGRDQSLSLIGMSQPEGRSKTDEREKSSNVFPMSDGRFQKRVLHLLTEIRNTMQQVGQRYEPLESEFHLSQATELNQFHALENSLVDLETRKLLVSIKLMNNIVMSEMNMDGNGGKVAFRKTAVFRVVTEGVLRNHQGTENDVANFVSRLLKYAPDRKGGSGRKEQ